MLHDTSEKRIALPRSGLRHGSREVSLGRCDLRGGRRRIEGMSQVVNLGSSFERVMDAGTNILRTDMAFELSLLHQHCRLFPGPAQK